MNVLIVVTSHDQLGDTGRPTGFWLEELAAPYYALQAAGAELTIASPRGGRAPFDPWSVSEEYASDLTRRFQADPEAQAAISSTTPLAEVAHEQFDAVYYPGGHGAVWDLPSDRDSIELIQSFDRAGKPVAFVCHASAALRDVQTVEGTPFVEGRSVTGFTNSEEAAIGLTEVVPFLLESELVARGAIFSRGTDWAPYVVEDGLLITGQNPESSVAVAQALIGALRVSA